MGLYWGYWVFNGVIFGVYWGFYWGYIGVILLFLLGLYWDYIGCILGLYGDSGGQEVEITKVRKGKMRIKLSEGPGGWEVQELYTPGN